MEIVGDIAGAGMQTPSQTGETRPEWRSRSSRGGLVAVGLALVPASSAVLALLYLAGRPVAIDSFVAAVVALAGLLLAAALGILAFGYYSMRYRLEEDRLVVRWLWTEERIPLAGVLELFKGRRLGERVRVKGLDWPGYLVGTASADGLDRVRFYGTSSDAADVVIIGTSADAYALTPADLAGFRSTLLGRLESLPEIAAAEIPSPETLSPALLRLPVLRDGVAVALLGTAVLAMLAGFGYVALRFPGLPELMPLHFNYLGQPDLIGPPRDAFRMPAIGLAVLVANLVLVPIVHDWRRDAGRVLAGGTLFVQVVMLMALLRVVH